MTRVWVILVTLVACKSSQSDCDMFMRKMADYSARKSGKTISADDYRKGVEVCKANKGKSDQADSKCVVAATDDAALEACMKAAGFDPDVVVPPRASVTKGLDCSRLAEWFTDLTKRDRSSALGELRRRADEWIRTGAAEADSPTTKALTAAFDAEALAAGAAAEAARTASADPNGRRGASGKLAAYVAAIRATDLAFARFQRPPHEGDSVEEQRRYDDRIALDVKAADRATALDDTIKALDEAIASCSSAP